MFRSVPSAPPAFRVRHYIAGGTEHGGGIGRLAGYILRAARSAHHAVTDTRGATWAAPRGALMLARAMAVMARDRVAAPRTIHHLHIAGRGSTARKLVLGAWARALGCRHVLHLHDFDYAQDYNRRPGWQKRAIRRLFAGAARVVVLGKRDRDTVVSLLGVPSARVSVLHNAVPDPGARGDLVGDRPVNILFLGTLGPRKGVPTLLSALADPCMSGGRWRAVLAGDGPVDNFRAEAARLGISARVTMPGWLDSDRTTALCREADILVLPSRAEGLAMAVLEGLAHGLAVVTTRVGAHEEILSDGATALFVPVDDARTLARTLARLVDDPAERMALGRAARAHYLSSLSMEAYMDRLNSVYHRLHRNGDAMPAIRQGAA